MAQSRVRTCTDAGDAPEIHRLIYALAEYEREPEAMVTTVSDFARDLNVAFHAALAEVRAGGDAPWRAVGVALYFQSYSSWTGRALYLEDIFVEPAARGNGLGLALMRHCAERAVEMGCARLQWVVLDWNARSIEFYKSVGAKLLSEWKLMRLEGGELAAFADLRPQTADGGGGGGGGGGDAP